ncbi:MAG: hypothetical protein J6A08_01320 [Lachnospiraceae bacterium]|nr:hypothetical protein [Lachnospiraceae bacterium]
MDIQEVRSKNNITGYQNGRKSGQTERFQESLIQNLKYQDQGREDIVREEMRMRKREEQTGVNVIGPYAEIRVALSTLTEAARAAEVRNMSYEESDHIEIAVADGYTLKGKIAEEEQVYVEAKYEDGRVEAYQVDMTKVSEQTEHKIEKFALETMSSVC